MKFRVILIVLTMISINTSEAQNFKGQLCLGLVGSQVSGDQLSGFDKAGFSMGGGVYYQLKNNHQVGFRMKYIQKGSRKPSDLENGDPLFYLLRLHYIELPVFYKFPLSKKIYFEVSPSFAYLFGTYEADQDGKMPYPVPFYNYDLSIGGAVGYPIADHFNFQLSYSQSVLPIRESNYTSLRLSSGQFNSILGFDLIYTFQKKATNNNK